MDETRTPQTTKDAPQVDAAPDETPDETIAAVRALMEGAKTPAPDASVRDRSVSAPNAAQNSMHILQHSGPERVDADPQPETVVPSSEPRTAPRSLARKIAGESRDALGLLAKFSWQLLRHPMTPRVMAVLACLALFLFYPLVAMILLFVTVMTGVIVYLSVGPEQVERFAARRFEKLRARDPERAERLRQRAIRVVGVLNKVIDRLPERWTSGLYLPDFDGTAEQPEKLQSDPFERLDGLGETTIMSARDLNLLERPSKREPRAEGKEYRYRRL